MKELGRFVNSFRPNLRYFITSFTSVFYTSLLRIFITSSTKMNKIEKFKRTIRFIVSIFASREFGFLYCVTGTLAQTAHTYYLIESISSLEGFWKGFQAAALSIFISSSLLFFTAIADNDEDSNDYKRIHLAVNLFMIIEIIINFYYYAAHLLLNTQKQNIFDFIFAILVSCLIPVTIKLYAGIIQAKEWLEALMENPSVSNTDKIIYDWEQIKQQTEQQPEQHDVNENVTESREPIEPEVKESEEPTEQQEPTESEELEEDNVWNSEIIYK